MKKTLQKLYDKLSAELVVTPEPFKRSVIVKFAEENGLELVHRKRGEKTPTINLFKDLGEGCVCSECGS